MYKSRLSYILPLLLLVFSCSRESLPEETAPMTVAVGLDNFLTKADMSSVAADRCIMGVFYEGSLYTRTVAPLGDDKTARFTVRLVTNRSYDICFWADKGDTEGGDLYYDTSSLPVVSVREPYRGSDPQMDAFFHSTNGWFFSNSDNAVHQTTLTRPFALVSAVNGSDGAADSPVTVSFSAPGSFNLLAGTLGQTVDFTYSLDSYQDFSSKLMCSDFIFAPTIKENMTYSVGGEAYTSVTIRRNFKTNLIIQ